MILHPCHVYEYTLEDNRNNNNINDELARVQTKISATIVHTHPRLVFYCFSYKTISYFAIAVRWRFNNNFIQESKIECMSFEKYLFRCDIVFEGNIDMYWI